jgi:hypothetical protein
MNNRGWSQPWPWWWSLTIPITWAFRPRPLLSPPGAKVAAAYHLTVSDDPCSASATCASHRGGSIAAWTERAEVPMPEPPTDAPADELARPNGNDASKLVVMAKISRSCVGYRSRFESCLGLLLSSGHWPLRCRRRIQVASFSPSSDKGLKRRSLL